LGNDDGYKARSLVKRIARHHDYTAVHASFLSPSASSTGFEEVLNSRSLKIAIKVLLSSRHFHSVTSNCVMQGLPRIGFEP
jgi:hypothetical protein